MVTSRLIIGGSGSGKSEGTLTELMKIARSRECAIVLMDPHGLLARKFMLHLVNEGMQGRVLYDQLSGFERVLAGMSLQPSSDPHPLRREAENHKRVNAFMNLLWRASQRDEDIFTMPMMSMYVEFGIRLMMFQKRPVPFTAFQFAYRLKHPICEYLVMNCTDEEVRDEWIELLRLSSRNSDNLLEQKVGPAKRLARSVFGLPAFRERCDGTFNIGKALEEKKIIIIDGSDDGSVAKAAATAVYGGTNLQIFHHLQQRFALTSKPTPTLVVWEEAPAIDGVGDYEIDMLREGRKFGFSGWVIGQDLGFLDDEIKQTVKSCTPEHVWYNPMDSDLAKEAAEDLAYAKFSARTVKHVQETERVIFDGYEKITTHGSSSSGDKKTESEHHGERASYRPITDKKPVFYTPDELLKEEIRKLLRLRPGERMVRSRAYVSESPEYVPMLPDPWPETNYPGCAEKKLQKGITESQKKAEFKTPVSLEQTWQPPATTTPSQPSGMIVSSGSSAKGSKRPQNKSNGQSPHSKRKTG